MKSESEKGEYKENFFLRSESGYYDGYLVNEKPEGIGKITWENGNFFEGEFRKGKKHGKGKKVNKDGSYFEGEYDDNTPVKGHYKWPDGMEYDGYVVDLTVGAGGTENFMAREQRSTQMALSIKGTGCSANHRAKE